MANLGDMVVSIVGDTTGLNKSLTESQKKMAAFGVNVAAVTAAMITIGKKVADAVKEFNDYGSAIYDASQKTGLSTDAIQEWKFIAEQTGTTLESITGAVGMMTRGLTTNAKEFDRLGIATKNSDGTFKTTTEIFNDTVKTLSAMSDETERDQMAFKLLGRSAQSLIPILNAGADGISEMRSEAHSLGLILDKETISNADQLGDSVDALKGALKNAKNVMVNEMAPAIINITNKLKDMIAKTTQAKKEWDAYQESIKKPISDIDKNALAIAGVTAQIEKNKEAIRTGVGPAVYASQQELIANQKLLDGLRLQQKELILIEKQKLKDAGVAERKAATEAEAAVKRAERIAMEKEAAERRRIQHEEELAALSAEDDLMYDLLQARFEGEQEQIRIINERKEADENAFQAYISGWVEADTLVDESGTALREKKIAEEKAAADAIAQSWMESYNMVAGVAKAVFEEIGSGIVEGELSWKSLGSVAVNAIGAIISALGDQLAADAAADLIKAIATSFLLPPLNAAAPGYYSSAAIKGGGAAAAWATGAALQSVKLAEGGVVMPQAGGTLAQIAEAGQPEAVIPLDKLDGMGGDIHLVVNMDSKPFLDKIFPATRNRTILISAGAVV